MAYLHTEVEGIKEACLMVGISLEADISGLILGLIGRSWWLAKACSACGVDGTDDPMESSHKVPGGLFLRQLGLRCSAVMTNVQSPGVARDVDRRHNILAIAAT